MSNLVQIGQQVQPQRTIMSICQIAKAVPRRGLYYVQPLKKGVNLGKNGVFLIRKRLGSIPEHLGHDLASSGTGRILMDSDG